MGIPVSTPERVAHKIVALTRDSGDEISKTKTMKIVYYCYAWFLVASENAAELFEEKPQAWQYGPVVPSVFEAWDLIVADTSEAEVFDESIEKFIHDVFALYSPLGKFEIVELSHSEDPWKEARGDLGDNDRSTRSLSRDTMYEYYSSLA